MSSPQPTRAIWLGAAAITVAALVAYGNSFSGPFLFDDLLTIVENPTIRQLGRAWWPPPSGGTGGRPLLNLTFGLNYALGGTRVEGYHAVNLLIHVLAGLSLFGLVRHTLLGPRFGQRLRERALPVALAAALLWTVHPLTTESVTAVTHRGESLMGLFYLLTLYCFARATESVAPRRWFALTLGTCFLGMATKEAMASAPLMVLLYDRTFVAGSFARAWRLRSRLYLGLASSWLLLLYLVLATHQRHGTVGFGLGIAWWAYALTQCRAIVHYLWLSLWPNPLVLDYGTEVVTDPRQVGPQALLLLALVTATAIALVRWPIVGFLGAWFFAILAPSSSVVPVTTQTMAEHRMYLPLAAVILLGLAGARSLLTRRALPAFVLLGALAAWRTARRNRDYRDEYTMWSTTVAAVPLNPRVHTNLGGVLFDLGRISEASEEYHQALRLQPDFDVAHYDLGALLFHTGRTEAAIEQFRQVVRITPDYLLAWRGLGDAELRRGRVEQAIAAYQQALRIKADSPAVRYNLGHALARAGRVAEAMEQYQLYLELAPDDAGAHGTLGRLLTQAGRRAEALAEFRAAARLAPDSATAHSQYAGALLGLGRAAEAVREYAEALRLRPGDAEAAFYLGNALVQAGQLGEAIAQYEQVLRLVPDHAETHHNLATVYQRLGLREQAKAHYQRALELSPGDDVARRNLKSLESH